MFPVLPNWLKDFHLCFLHLWANTTPDWILSVMVTMALRKQTRILFCLESQILPVWNGWEDRMNFSGQGGSSKIWEIWERLPACKSNFSYSIISIFLCNIIICADFWIFCLWNNKETQERGNKWPFNIGKILIIHLREKAPLPLVLKGPSLFIYLSHLFQQRGEKSKFWQQ